MLALPTHFAHLEMVGSALLMRSFHRHVPGDSPTDIVPLAVIATQRHAAQLTRVPPRRTRNLVCRAHVFCVWWLRHSLHGGARLHLVCTRSSIASRQSAVVWRSSQVYRSLVRVKVRVRVRGRVRGRVKVKVKVKVKGCRGAQG